MPDSPSPSSASGLIVEDTHGVVKVKLLKKIGQGGCGQAWSAKYYPQGRQSGGRACVVKITNRALSAAASTSQPGGGGGAVRKEEEYMAGEAALLKMLKHPNILDFYDYFRGSDGREYLVTECGEHGDWGELVRGNMREREDAAEAHGIDSVSALLLYYIGGHCTDHAELTTEIFESLNGLWESGAFAALSEHVGVVEGIEEFVSEPTILSAEALLVALHAASGQKAVVSGGDCKHAWGLLQQVLRGLDYAHKMGVVHRDLKWENLFSASRSSERQAYGDSRSIRKAILGDFGIAERVTPADLSRNFVAGADLPCGTIAYLPPEAADGVISTAGDIWALGVMMHELIAGRHPFLPRRGLVPAEVFQRISNVYGLYNLTKLYDAGLLRQRRSGARVTRELCEIVDSMLRVKPDERPTAAEVLGHAVFAEQLFEHWEKVIAADRGERGRSGEESEGNRGRLAQAASSLALNLHTYHSIPFPPQAADLLSAETCQTSRALFNARSKVTRQNGGLKLGGWKEKGPPLPIASSINSSLG